MTTATSPRLAAPLSSLPALPPRRHLFTRLQHDWVRLTVSRVALADVERWELPGHPVASLDDLLRRTGYGSVGGCTGEHDALLTHLVGLARHDELAARVVLQRILPGLWALSRRRQSAEHEDRTGSRPEDDEVLSTAWTVIRCFSVTHRQDHVAARMLKEIEYRVYRRPYRRLATFVPTPTTDLDRPVHADPLVDATALLAMVLVDARRRGLADDDVTLLREWGAGAAADELATRLCVTERTIRNRRAAALRRVQTLVGDLADAG